MIDNNQDSLLNRYVNLNKSFRKKLVFRIGMEAGFFSEYNNMILAMLYCLENKIQFVLYSVNANFAYQDGWNDYFLPFCDEVKHDFHRQYNHRYPGAPFTHTDRLKICIWKKIYGVHFLTHELWHQIRDKEYFEKRTFFFPELDIDGDVHHACEILTKMTWRYNDHTQKTIDRLTEPLALPAEYIGLHIRQGDKCTEQELITPDVYLRKAESLSDLKNAFILTDDYAVIEHLEKEYPTWNIYTLCDTEERGYVHADFEKQSKGERCNAMIRLFASVKVLSHSALFVGTFSSNPGMFIGMRMPVDRCYGLDSDRWQIW